MYAIISYICPSASANRNPILDNPFELDEDDLHELEDDLHELEEQELDLEEEEQEELEHDELEHDEELLLELEDDLLEELELREEEHELAEFCQKSVYRFIIPAIISPFSTRFVQLLGLLGRLFDFQVLNIHADRLQEKILQDYQR